MNGVSGLKTTGNNYQCFIFMVYKPKRNILAVFYAACQTVDVACSILFHFLFSQPISEEIYNK